MNTMMRIECVNAAIMYARRNGYDIIDLDPTESIDFVAWNQTTGMMVFVVVRCHKNIEPAIPPFCGDRFSVRSEITRWCRKCKWEKIRTRIDVIHVYCEERTVIDHIQNIMSVR